MCVTVLIDMSNVCVSVLIDMSNVCVCDCFN